MSHVVSYMLIFSIIEIGGAGPGLRIIGGKDADEDRYEYIVRLVFQFKFAIPGLSKYKQSCTGAVLNPTWTLSAAHCIINEKVENALKLKKISIVPVIQTNTKNHTYTSETIFRVVAIFRHPSFVVGYGFVRNDIALLKTAEIQLGQFARLSALDVMTLVGQKVILFGHGLTHASGTINDTMSLKKPLQKIDAVVTKCNKELPMRPAMCVARRCGQSAGLCAGDSGGPMLHPSGIVAINSIGGLDEDVRKFCKLKNTKPNYEVGVLTPVNPFIEWISFTMDSNANITDSSM